MGATNVVVKTRQQIRLALERREFLMKTAETRFLQKIRLPPNELRPRNKAAGAEANRKSGLRRVENAQSSAA